MTNSPSQEDIDYLQAMYYETAGLPPEDQAEQTAAVEELARELHLSSYLLELSGLQLAKAKGVSAETAETPKLTVTPDQIAWLGQPAEVELVPVEAPNGTTFLWGDITKLNGTIRKNVPDPGVMSKIVPAMQRHVGTVIEDHHSSSLRKEEEIRSSLIAYKDDNLMNNDYRGLLLRTHQGDSEVFLLAAAFPHTAQSKVMNVVMSRDYTN